MQTVQRIFFLLLMAAGVMVLPWSAIFGILCYCVARFRWYFESLLLGVLVDMLSGLPFAFFVVLFAALVLVSEKIKPFFQEDGLAGAVGKTFAVVAIWWAMSMAGLLAVDWSASVYGLSAFWASGFYALLYGALAAAILLILHYLVAAVYERLALRF